MITANSGKLIGYIATLISDKEVVSVNATEYVTTVVTATAGPGKLRPRPSTGRTLW